MSTRQFRALPELSPVVHLDRKPAWLWLERAIEVAGKVDMRLKALDEPELEPIWVDIAEI